MLTWGVIPRVSHTASVGALLLILVACGSPPAGPAASIVILVDYSRSFAPLGEEDKPALAVIRQAVEKASVDQLQQPVKILWSVIGDESLNPFQPCKESKSFEVKIIGTSAAPPNTLINVGQLRGWLEACTAAVIAFSKSPQQYTDISGAVAFASANAKSAHSERILIIFSDFLEDLPPGHMPTALELGGERVVMLWRSGLDDHSDPAAIVQRLGEWEKRLQNAGAKSTCVRPAIGLAADDLSPCLVMREK
jgi:hypothetical protein